MEHVVLPLDGDHVRAARRLVAGIAESAHLGGEVGRPEPHVTLIAYTGGDPAAVRAGVESVGGRSGAFHVHAHGYGFFSGKDRTELALHVPVVRSALLDELHGALCAALDDAGAEVATWCAPHLWTPHVTLVDRGLTPATLAAGVAWLAERHHPSWQIPVDRVALTGGWAERDLPAEVIGLSRRSPA